MKNWIEKLKKINGNFDKNKKYNFRIKYLNFNQSQINHQKSFVIINNNLETVWEFYKHLDLKNAKFNGDKVLLNMRIKNNHWIGCVLEKDHKTHCQTNDQTIEETKFVSEDWNIKKELIWLNKEEK